MKVVRRHGRPQLCFAAPEVDSLLELFRELELVLAGAVDGSDPVVQRLFPAAYRDDARAEEEYRDLTEATLRSDRQERIAVCRADLAGGPEVTIDPDTGRRWIQLLNDLRLAVGTRLGITEDDDHLVTDDDDPRIIYYWLTAMQDDIVALLLPR